MPIKLAAVLTAALLAGAANAHETPFGQPADPKKAQRIVHVDMSDAMRFAPSDITLKQGETVRFVVRNKGKVMHELVLGRIADLKAHAEMMKQHAGMAHDDPNIVHVAPGKRGELGWQFTKAGEFHYACLIPGHFEAGMIGKITVKPS